MRNPIHIIMRILAAILFLAAVSGWFLVMGCASGQVAAESAVGVAGDVTGAVIGDGTLMMVERLSWPVALTIIVVTLGFLGRNISIVWRGHVESQKGCPINEE